MKKIISVLLVMLMMLTVLTGCGTEELGYLKLQKEMNEIKQAEFTNKTTIEIKAGELTEQSKDSKIEIETNGDINVEDITNPYVNLNIGKGIYDEFELEEPVKIKVVDGKVYVSTNIFNEANNYYISLDEIDPEFESQYEEIKKYEFWEMKDVSGVNQNTELAETISDNYEDIVKSIEKLFNNFETGLVEKITNGYKIEIDTDEAIQLIGDTLEYLDKNRDDAVSTIGDTLRNLVDETEYTDDLEDNINETIDEAIGAYNSGEFDVYARLFKGTEIIEEITKVNGTYKQDLSVKIMYEGKELVTLKSITTVKEAKVDKETLGGTVITDEVLSEITDAYSLVGTSTIWIVWNNESDETVVYGNGPDGVMFDEVSNYVLIEDRVYLPLRYIGEKLGEQVGWDNDLRQAYVTKDGVQIDMTGVIINDKTMVKIRDFEKLGYTVEYYQENGESTALIYK